MKNIYQYLIVFSVLFFAGCDDFLDEEPVDVVVNQNAIRNLNDLNTATLGVYDTLQSFWNRYYLYQTMVGDEAVSRIGSFQQYAQNELTVDSSQTRNMWTFLYKAIHDTTFILEAMDRLEDLDTTERDSYIGELKFLRAYCYIKLCQLFGDVPLMTTTNIDVNRNLPRTPVIEIYNSFLLPELEESENLISTEYESVVETKTRATTGAVQALLANLHLLVGNWDEAEDVSTRLIDDSTYILVEEYESLFIDNTFSDESIWQPYYDENDINSLERRFRVSRWATPSDFILNSFETNDSRLNTSISESQPGVFVVNKFRDEMPGDDRPYLFRLAEIYLYRAEARARNNNITGALEDINLIRSRAGLDSVSASSMEEVLLLVEQERLIELCFETKRWEDLLRTGRADAVMSVYNEANWDSDIDILWPIPLQDLDSNPNINQNPGY